MRKFLVFIVLPIIVLISVLILWSLSFFFRQDLLLEQERMKNTELRARNESLQSAIQQQTSLGTTRPSVSTLLLSDTTTTVFSGETPLFVTVDDQSAPAMSFMAIPTGKKSYAVYRTTPSTELLHIATFLFDQTINSTFRITQRDGVYMANDHIVLVEGKQQTQAGIQDVRFYFDLTQPTSTEPTWTVRYGNRLFADIHTSSTQMNITPVTTCAAHGEAEAHTTGTVTGIRLNGRTVNLQPARLMDCEYTPTAPHIVPSAHEIRFLTPWGQEIAIDLTKKNPELRFMDARDHDER